MLCFEVLRNGKLLARAARPEKGVLVFEMHRLTASQRGDPDGQRFDLHAFDWGVEPNEIARWCSDDLAVGDEFVVRVAEREDADPPTKRELMFPPDTEEIIAKKREHLAQLEEQVAYLRRSLGLEMPEER